MNMLWTPELTRHVIDPNTEVNLVHIYGCKSLRNVVAF